MHVSVLDIGYIGIHHEGDEIENEVRRFTEDGESGEAKVLEAGVVHRLGAAHCVDHFFADFDGGWKRLWIAAEDVTEVDVEEVACWVWNSERPR